MIQNISNIKQIKKMLNILYKTELRAPGIFSHILVTRRPKCQEIWQLDSFVA